MSNLRLALQRAWLEKGPLAWALWPISWVYGALVLTNKLLYRLGVLKKHHLNVPVLIVGNVFVGGVGKTPLLIALAQHFKARGIPVGVLSRGYGRKDVAARVVKVDSLASEVGDEPLLIAQSCHVPVVVGRDRYAAGQALLASHPDIGLILCDDGLQHFGLAHDLALCVFDARHLGNGWLLPAGPLREPWPLMWASSLDVLTLQTVSAGAIAIQSTPKSFTPNFQVPRVLANFVRCSDGTTFPLERLRGQSVQALAGIAQPQNFFDMLMAQGIRLSCTHALNDHADMDRLTIDPAMGPLLCTEKDAVKLWQYLPSAWAVPLHTEVPDALMEEILRRLGPKLSSGHGHQTA